MKIYIDNRLDKTLEISFDEIVAKFNDSIYYQNYRMGVYEKENALSLFLAAKDGLNCTYENEDFKNLLAHTSQLEIKIVNVKNGGTY